MKIEQEKVKPVFAPVHITIESPEELFVFYSVFARSRKDDIIENSENALKDSVLIENVKKLIHPERLQGKDFAYNTYRKLGDIVKRLELFNYTYAASRSFENTDS